MARMTPFVCYGGEGRPGPIPAPGACRQTPGTGYTSGAAVLRVPGGNTRFICEDRAGNTPCLLSRP